MAVGRGTRHELGGDDAAGTRNVLHHERPAEAFRELRREHPPQDVRVATRGRRGDQADRLRRVILRHRRRGEGESGYKDELHHIQPRLSTNRGALTLASNSFASVPRGSSVTSGVTWKVVRTLSRMRARSSVLSSTKRWSTSLAPLL